MKHQWQVKGSRLWRRLALVNRRSLVGFLLDTSVPARMGGDELLVEASSDSCDDRHDDDRIGDSHARSDDRVTLMV
jgi:hypothetical protein